VRHVEVRGPNLKLSFSEFFNDLLNVPSVQPISEAPIHLAQNANIVRHYVDYVTSTRPYNIRFNSKVLQQLLDLCDQLQSPAIEKNVLGFIQATLDEERCGYPGQDFDPWTVFTIAAQRDNLSLAKSAIKWIYHSEVDLRNLLIRKAPAFYDDAPPRYFHALLRCTFHPVRAFEWSRGPVDDFSEYKA
jgi:hypothetical protein